MTRATAGRAAKAAGAALLAPVRFTVLATPRTKKTSNRVVRAGGRRRVLPSEAFKEFEARAVPQLRSQWVIAAALQGRGRDAAGRVLPVNAPVNVAATFYREADRGDLVGYMQAIADVLEAAGVLVNDKWIVSWDGTRLDKDAHRPRVEIEIAPR